MKKLLVVFLLALNMLAQEPIVQAEENAQTLNTPARLVIESVSSEDFPHIKVSFRLMDASSQRVVLEEENFTVWEDGTIIKDIQYIPQPLPLHIIYIVLFNNLDQLNENWLTEPMGETYNDLWETLNEPNNQDSHELCFALSAPPTCTERLSGSQVDMPLFFERKRNMLQNSVDNIQLNLAELINTVVDEAEKRGQSPVIIVYKVANLDVNPQRDLSENMLRRLKANNGLLVFIEENPYPPYDEERFARYLIDLGVGVYLGATGTAPIETEDCSARNNRCLQYLINFARDQQHLLSFRSKLFQDRNHHLISISYQNNQLPAVSDTIEFSLDPLNDYSRLLPIVRNTNIYLALLAPFSLILILVFAVSPRRQND